MVSRNASEFGIVSRNSDSSQGDGAAISAPIGPVERTQGRAGANTVFKSGHLFISNKGMGWTSWKKRWFILTRTSLIFFRSDPNAFPQKSGEVNLTLGGIDLNNSGSVVVKADKKLLTVQFPDGRDGRTFTLKAETLENLHDWKTALENALAQAPSAALGMGQTGIFRNELADSIEGSFEQWRDKRSVKCSVIGRPILLALEEVDGSPSFLEKALRFLEEYGIKVEGILRQSADVEEVERRVQEYEEGKTEFSSEEDAHIVGDCVKYVLREFPSFPVPASCCTALLEAYRNEHEDRVDTIRDAVAKAFPEPNRRLLQRILKMMQTVASNTSVNRMSSSAVAACMAPLLLRPLMAGDCVPENDFDTSGDDCSAQLLAAAAAANHANAIISILLEEYDYIFLDGLRKGSLSDMYSESGSEDSGSEEESNYDDELLGIMEGGYHDAENDLDLDMHDDPECSSSGTLSESSGNVGSDTSDDQGSDDPDSQGSECPDTDGDSAEGSKYFEAQQKPSQEALTLVQHHGDLERNCSDSQTTKDNSTAFYERESHGDILVSTSPKFNSSSFSVPSCTTESISQVHVSVPSIKHQTIWGRTPARKNLSMESIDYSNDDETVIERLELTKSDLRGKIEKEAKRNAILQANLERRKQALHEHRSALEQDVARLQEQLQRERDLRAAFEAGLNMSPGQLCVSSIMDSKIKAELEEIVLAEEDVTNLKKKVADLHQQLNQQCQNSGSVCDSCSQNQYMLTTIKQQGRFFS